MKNIKNYIRHIWVLNFIVTLVILSFGLQDQYFTGSVSRLSQIQGDPFEGAIYPIAFVPDWRKGSYIENRATLRYENVPVSDLIALPDPRDIDDDFDAHFTYMTMFMGKYIDEDREIGVGGHNGVDIRAPINTPLFAIANGVVVEAETGSNGDKHVVVAHRDVDFRGKVGTYYSNYLHMNSIDVREGDVVSQGDQVGTVGLTGVTTTPHLHFQIDNEDAPFHPYWHFNMSEAYAANLTFWDAVNTGFQSEKILKYSVDPIEFIRYAKPANGRSSTTTSSRSTPQPTPQPEPEEDEDDVEVEVNSAPSTPRVAPPRVPRVPSAPREVEPRKDLFPDVPGDHENYKAIKYFIERGVINGYEDGNFGPENTLTRSELLAIVLKALDIDHSGEILLDIFSDIPEEHWVHPLVNAAVDREIITTTRPVFEYDREVTKAEFLAIMFVASGEGKNFTLSRKLTDVDKDDWYASFAQATFVYKLFNDYSSKRFEPNRSVKRGEVSEAMYRFLKATDRIED